MDEFDREWDRLPIAELQRLDAVCDRFEQALTSDPNARRIESFVTELSESQQRLVVRELVQLEIEQRHACGQQPVAEDYAQRFPQWADELQAMAARAIEKVRTATPAAPHTIQQIASADTDTKTTPSPTTPLPQSPGHYQLQELIGRGGMGLVVRARDTTLERDVAIKCLSPEISHMAGVVERFSREARAVAGIRHKHVVTIHAIEEFDGSPFLVMEFVDGTNLEAYLRTRGQLSPSEVVILAHQISQGLAAAHQEGLVHRDVKPANILLENIDQPGSGLPRQSTWNAKLTDFGLARMAAEAGLTGAGQIAGTPQYMSPEQANGQVIDARSDLFSLGSVMYAMCAGRAPFEADSPIAITRLVADKPTRSLREVSPDTPHWLIEIVERLMAKSPDERFQSAEEVAELLGRHIDQPPTGVTTTGNDIDGQARSDTRHRRRTVMAAAVAIVGIAAAFGMRGVFPEGEKGVGVDAQTPDVELTVAAKPDDTQRWHGWPVDAPAPAIAPFDADEAAAYQETWAGYLGMDVEITNSIGMKLRFIPPGEFMMGCTEEEIVALVQEAEERGLNRWHIERIEFEGPQHHVTLTKPFGASIYEVTRGQFRQFVEATAYKTDAETDGQGGDGWQDGQWVAAAEFRWNTSLGVSEEQTDDHPVVNVSWNDAVAFCNWLSRKEGVTYRLPTEAEWEYACRAGSLQYVSDSPLDDSSWHQNNSGRSPHVVGQKAPNAWGLFDLYGNAFEWCRDEWYGPYSKAPVVAPTQSAAPGVGADVIDFNRMLRGASYRNAAEEFRSTLRRSNARSFRNATTGFRPIRVYSPTPPSLSRPFRLRVRKSGEGSS